jgi:hypothetical protein
MSVTFGMIAIGGSATGTIGWNNTIPNGIATLIAGNAFA